MRMWCKLSKQLHFFPFFVVFQIVLDFSNLMLPRCIIIGDCLVFIGITSLANYFASINSFDFEFYSVLNYHFHPWFFTLFVFVWWIFTFLLFSTFFTLHCQCSRGKLFHSTVYKDSYTVSSYSETIVKTYLMNFKISCIL